MMEEVHKSFDSIIHLRNDLLETAFAMFGNGYVWLVRERSTGKLSVLPTYNAGSPLPEAHHRQQSRDMSTNSWSGLLSDRLTKVQNTVGSFGRHSQFPGDTYPDALIADPLLCVSCWQHMWVGGYGLLAKETYLGNWWLRIDWSVVAARLSTVQANSRGQTNRLTPGRLRTSMNR